MEYINCFQITSLVLVTMIAIHYFSHKRLNYVFWLSAAFTCCWIC